MLDVHAWRRRRRGGVGNFFKLEGERPYISVDGPYTFLPSKTEPVPSSITEGLEMCE